ncbi:hypothetical protein [Phenylobacterium sp.]|uniref:hypothetical protein n=1 Tax=Phenylobacterium sp. TaxID=1871053 RepID=UPI0025EAC4FE|nr:hypothetical protein [Phenylobacterium sp.]
MDYKNYGLKDGFAPNIYVEKVIMDYVGPSEPVNMAGIQLQIKLNIVIQANNYESFQNMLESPDFGNNTFINTYAFINSDTGLDTPIGSDPLLESLLSNFDEDPFYKQTLQEIITKANERDISKFTLASIASSVVADSQTKSLFEKISLYQKQLPNGNFYYQIPYNFTRNFYGITSPRDLHLFTFSNVEDFNFDFNLDLGGFAPDSEIELQMTNIPVGQLNVETLIENGETKNVGIIAKISENQRTYEDPQSAALTADVDILRENKFLSMANSVWLGGIHKHPQVDRYMAGGSHSGELHPFVDLVPVLNSKLIDLRSLRDLGNSNLAELQSKLSLLNTSEINYGNNVKEDLLQKLNVISDPLLSMRLDKNVDGIFGIDYISFIRKHSVFSGLIDFFPLGNPAESLSQQLNLSEVIGQSLKIKITRIDEKSKESKLIYDSSRADENGVFFDRPNFETIGFLNNNQKKFELGHLNVINLEKNNLNTNNTFNAIEFYTFTDLDSDKKLNTDYHYNIEIELLDPMFVFLENGLNIIDNAINGSAQGTGKKTIGLKQFLNIVRATRGINKSVYNNSKENTYSYVSDGAQQEANTYSSSSIFEIMKKYDEENQVESFVEVPDPLGNTSQLKVINNLFNNNFMKVLVTDINTIDSFYNNISRILNLNKRSLNILKTLDIDYIQQLINLLTQIEYNIREKINAVSNIDIKKQTTGIGLATSIKSNESNKRIIVENKISQTKITVKEAGFNYLSKLGSDTDLYGAKKISHLDYNAAVQKFYSQYYDLSPISSKPDIVKQYIERYLPSYLFLQKPGVALPEAFDSNDSNWNQILQKLLLYKQKNISKLTQNTIFTYTQSDQEKIFINNDASSIENAADENEFKLLKSLDRGQRQLVKKGLSLPERIYKGQKFFDPIDEGGIANESEDQTFNQVKVNLLNNLTTEYFLSYVNNAVENGNKNKSLTLNVDINNFSLNVSDLSHGYDGTTLPVLSLINLGDQSVAFSNTGKKQNGASFLSYYSSNVWAYKANSANPSALHFDRYGDFFFEFINSVKVEYLSGFDAIDLSYLLNLNSLARDAFPESQNINLSSYNWQLLEQQAIDNTSIGKVLLCRLTDFIPSAFSFLNIPLISELKFYDKYYKYFLINKSGGVKQSTASSQFGSTL